MEKALEELSASSLRSLLNAEVRKFIDSLDYSSTEELERMKQNLRRIFDLITEKEKAETTPLTWGKNSTKSIDSQPDLTDEFLSDAQTA